jgi:hypothetical protein
MGAKYCTLTSPRQSPRIVTHLLLRPAFCDALVMWLLYSQYERNPPSICRQCDGKCACTRTPTPPTSQLVRVVGRHRGLHVITSKN